MPVHEHDCEQCRWVATGVRGLPGGRAGEVVDVWRGCNTRLPYILRSGPMGEYETVPDLRDIVRWITPPPQDSAFVVDRDERLPALLYAPRPMR